LDTIIERLKYAVREVI